MYDCIIIGGGIAGITAGIYLARANIIPLIIEEGQIGGQIALTSRIQNYPGIIEISGEHFVQTLYEQAKNFGVQFLFDKVEDINFDTKEIKTSTSTLKTHTILLCTGTKPRTLHFKGEEKFIGRGIAYCATCDGPFYEGCEIFVIGGGYAACEEAIFLTKYATKITMIVRENDFTCAPSLADEVKKHPHIHIEFNTELIEANGNEQLESLVFKRNDGTIWTYSNSKRFGVFIFVGQIPQNSLFKGILTTTKEGTLIVNNNQETNLKGIYAAGDICEKSVKQLITAASDGAIAAMSIEKYLKDIPKDPIQQIFEHNSIPVKVSIQNNPIGKEIKEFIQQFNYPNIENKNDTKSYISFLDRIYFNTSPNGHEYNSFVHGLHYASNSHEPIMMNISKHHIDLYTLPTCSNCATLALNLIKLATDSPNLTLHIHDLKHCKDVQDKYNIQSVPCMIIDKEKLYFGNKDIKTLITLLK